MVLSALWEFATTCTASISGGIGGTIAAGSPAHAASSALAATSPVFSCRIGRSRPPRRTVAEGRNDQVIVRSVRPYHSDPGGLASEVIVVVVVITDHSRGSDRS